MGNKNIANYLEIGQKIKSIRSTKELSQRELAKKINIPVTSLSNYENGNRVPSVEILEKIEDNKAVLSRTYDSFLAARNAVRQIDVETGNYIALLS